MGELAYCHQIGIIQPVVLGLILARLTGAKEMELFVSQIRGIYAAQMYFI